jgi:hypothetical protein
MFELTIEKANSNFQISLGEEGAVVIYSVDGRVQTRLFIRTTEPHDTQKLMQLLNADKEASISIYLDTMDQSYVERKIAGVNIFSSVNKLVQAQLEREIPKNYLKTFVPVGKVSSESNDWVYTFIATAYEPPLSSWIVFLTPLPNIVEGIYFLPLELAPIIKQFRVQEKKKPERAGLGFEIIIFQSKTGGFRQAVYLNGRIIVSRLLKNISHPDPDVMAGNVEQELSNSIDYIHSLNLEKGAPISVYIVLSQSILRFIRIDRIKAQNIEVFTPYQAALRLGFSSLSNERDKFFDPIFLACISGYKAREKRLHIDKTKKAYNFSVMVYQVKRIAVLLILFMLFLTFMNLYSFYSDQLSIKYLQTQIAKVSKALETENATIDELVASVEGNIPLKQISEVVDLDKFMKKTNESPVNMALKLSETLPEYARVTRFRWTYFDKTLPRFRSIKLVKQVNISEPKEFKVILSLNIGFINKNETGEELQGRYDELTVLLKEKFPFAQINLSELPSDPKDPIVEVRIMYPTATPEVKNIAQSKED